MSKQREARFKVKVKKQLETLPNSWWLVTNPLFAAGTPDLIGCYQGEFYAIELKVDNNDATTIQKHVLAKIAEAGGCTYVVNEKGFELLFKELQLV